MINQPLTHQPLTYQPLTRRELALRALAGAAGVLLAPSLLAPSLLAPAASAQAVDPLPAAPPPLPTTPIDSKPMNEGELLTQLVPVNAGYALSDAQAKEVALQLKDYPGGFAKARTYALPDDVGPAFAAAAPPRKEQAK